MGPLVLSNIGVRDGGSYTCLLEVKLRNKKKYNVSDTTVIRSKLSYVVHFYITYNPTVRKKRPLRPIDVVVAFF